MALQLGALRNALLEAGATPDAADKASEKVAGYEREFTAIRTDMHRDFTAVRGEIGHLRNEMNHAFTAIRSDIAGMRADIRMLKWAQGATFAGTIAIILKLFLH